MECLGIGIITSPSQNATSERHGRLVWPCWLERVEPQRGRDGGWSRTAQVDSRGMHLRCNYRFLTKRCGQECTREPRPERNHAHASICSQNTVRWNQKEATLVGSSKKRPVCLKRNSSRLIFGGEKPEIHRCCAMRTLTSTLRQFALRPRPSQRSSPLSTLLAMARGTRPATAGVVLLGRGAMVGLAGRVMMESHGVMDS